jgi:hypothetical protein
VPPMTAMSVPRGTCPDGTLGCAYPNGTSCSCTVCCDSIGCTTLCNGAPEGSLNWECTPGPVLEPPCPAIAPNDGTPCSLPAGTACPASTCGIDIACDGQRWHWAYATDTCSGSGSSGGRGVCASPATPIATPEGERPISEIRVGDLVYSVDREGIRAVPVVRVMEHPVHNHHVVRVRLANGRVLAISPGHPTADRRRFSDLQAGGSLDGQIIESAELVPYEDSATYDILPASDTGTYFASGVQIGSTLR